MATRDGPRTDEEERGASSDLGSASLDLAGGALVASVSAHGGGGAAGGVFGGACVGVGDNGAHKLSALAVSPRAISAGWRTRVMFSRSYPGAPLKERHQPFDQPFDALSARERAAAATLGMTNPDQWEARMPRRVRGHGDKIVDHPMERPHAQLTPAEVEAAALLGLTEHVWDAQLATFHHSLWALPGVCLSEAMFTPLLASLKSMARRPLQSVQIAKLLLSLERLLLPSQGAAICAVLSAAPAAAHEPTSSSGAMPLPALVASFLTHPRRFVDVTYLQTLSTCWDDQLSGCVWGNAHGAYTDEAAPPHPRPTYQQALVDRHARNERTRFAAGPILAGRLPPTLSARNEDAFLPALPEHLAMEVLALADETGRIHPLEVSWMKCYGRSWTEMLTAEEQSRFHAHLAD